MFITYDRGNRHLSSVLGKDICFYNNDGTKYDEGIIDSCRVDIFSPKFSIKLKSGSTTEHGSFKERWEIFNYDGEGISLVWGGKFSDQDLSSIKQKAKNPLYPTRTANINTSIEKLYDLKEYTIPRCEGEHSELIDGNLYIIKPSKNPPPCDTRGRIIANSYFLWSCNGAKINPITGKFYYLYHHIWWFL